jgi:SAM-dependent methyltransferase
VSGVETATHEAELKAANNRIRELERELDASESLRAELEASRSWRLTAPLRDSRWRLRDIGLRLKLRGQRLANDAAYVRSEVGWRIRRSRNNLASVGAFDQATPQWLEILTESLTRIPVRSTKRLLYNRRYWSTGDPLKVPLYHALADALYDELRPARAVDVGCGTGIMLARLAERGVEIQGIEGSRAAIAASPVGDRIEHRDLVRDVPDLGRYDLCLCIEVAEHLPPASGPALVAGLTRLSDLIVFTAATPGQGGMAHLNERPHEYWISRFAERGFEQSPLRDRLRETVAAVPDAPWVQKNLHVFAKAQEPRS